MALEFVSGFVASSLLQDLVDRIKASAADKISLVYSSDIEGELKCLQASYAKAQDMLACIDGWDLITSQTHRDWVSDVWRACYETEDYIEHLKLEILKKIGDASFLSSFWKRLGVSSKLRDLQSNLDCLIVASGFLVTSNCRCTERRQLLAINTEPVSVPDDESFKRKQVKEEIIGFLTTVRSSVVLISGMFGIGKTTLAQVVRNDPRIQGGFDHRLWVSVSGDFDLMKALCSMIIDLQEEEIQEPCPDKIYVRRFKALFKGRRVLVVLDDLCRFSRPQDWEDFQSLLLDSSCIFGIIITTRNPKVAGTIATLSIFPTVSHYLERMSDEDCQSLLLQKAVSTGANYLFKRKRCGRSSLEMNALQIAERFCKGLPLVADIIGQPLTSTPEARWSVMLSKDLWDMPEFREQIFPAFRLNYSDLSLSLKHCLPYFSLFPDNYNFKKDELIQLWLAEGFIKPQVAGLQYLEYVRLEELGSHYFDEVLSQSILQIIHPFNQEPQIYRMHEFIRRYAQYIGSDMYVTLGEQVTGASSVLDDCASGSMNPKSICSTVPPPNRNARHLSFLCPSIPPPVWKDIEKCHGLRTILSLHRNFQIGEISYTLFLKLQSLRVLDLSDTDIIELPESLGKLKHLRFLDVSGTDIEELPRSTIDLYGLQVLKLDNCPMLLQLPKGLKSLTQLLYLEVDIRGLCSKPRHIGRLSNLRSLRAFIVGKKEGYRVTELKNMKYLQGSICLTNLENVMDEVEAREARLSNKPFLKRLELEWNKYSRDQSLVEAILTELEPHENLEELQLTGFDGARFPSWLSSSDCKLTSIHLVKCDWCTVLPALGQLQHLKALHLEEMRSVKYIDNHFSGSGEGVGFPSLEYLRFQDMGSLEKWEGLQATQMPHLRDLSITDCPNFTALPLLSLLTSLVKLEISSCPVLQALPEEGLPISLETLIIVRSDLLKQRCLPKQGADWEKTRAICNVVIDFVRISQTASES